MFEGMSPLHCAASRGFDRISAMLLRQRVHLVLTRDIMGREPMHEAVISGALNVVKTIRDGECFTSDCLDYFGLSPMHYAVMLGSDSCGDIIGFLVRMCEFDTNTRVKAESPQLEDVKKVAEKMAGQEKQSHKSIEKIQRLLTVDDTPLHIATKTGNLKAVLSLMELGADARAANAEFSTCLHCCVRLANDAHAEDETAIHHEIFKKLLTHGAKVNAVDKNGRTVVHVAAESNAAHILAYLMLHNTTVNVRAKDVMGKTPLLIAVANGNARCVEVIQGSHPESLDDVDFNGNSALHEAAGLDDYHEIVQILLDFGGIDATLTNNARKTAKDIALEMGKADLAEILQRYTDDEMKKAMDEYKALEKEHSISHDAQFTDPELVEASKEQQPASMPPLPTTTTIREIKHDQDLQTFVDQFSGPDHSIVRVPQGTTPHPPQESDREDTSMDPVALVKTFLDRYASRLNFDRVIRWKRKGHGLDPPLNKATMGYEDMLTLLKSHGLMDQLVARPEVYSFFITKVHGQGRAIAKEVTYSVFRSYMCTLANKAPPELLQSLISQPETLINEEVSEIYSDRNSSDDDEMDSLSTSGTLFNRDLIDPSEYVPTVTGVNSPQSRPLSRSSEITSSLLRPGSSRPLSRSLSSRRRSGSHSSQSPERLLDAFRDFSVSNNDKIRIDTDAGPLQTASWAPGMSFSKKNKSKLCDIKSARGILGRRQLDSRESFLDTKGTGLRSSSSLGKGLSRGNLSSLGQSSNQSLIWKPMGCSRSVKVIEDMQKQGMAIENFKSIANLTHFLKPIWIDFFPSVAPMPQLIDAAHEVTYSMCFEKGDYVGCFEVIQSSLNHTPGDQYDLYQRMYAQAVVFCNSYALRCIRARNLAAAASLLRKSEDMTGPSVQEYPGRKALRGWTMDAHAQYYFERKKMNASLQYMQRAMDLISHVKTAEGKATWRGHVAAILSSCNRTPEALEFLKDALSEILGTSKRVITKEDIVQRHVPHAYRPLAAALCFNMSVCHAQMNHLEHAVTCCRFALLLCDQGDDKSYWNRMQQLHDILVQIVETRAAMPTLRRTKKSLDALPPRSDSAPPII
jgi:ankyrin repeat protein